jgi:hypothetical protein
LFAFSSIVDRRSVSSSANRMKGWSSRHRIHQAESRKPSASGEGGRSSEKLGASGRKPVAEFKGLEAFVFCFNLTKTSSFKLGICRSLEPQIWCTTRRYRSRWTRSVRGEYRTEGNEPVPAAAPAVLVTTQELTGFAYFTGRTWPRRGMW